VGQCLGGSYTLKQPGSLVGWALAHAVHLNRKPTGLPDVALAKAGLSGGSMSWGVIYPKAVSRYDEIAPIQLYIFSRKIRLGGSLIP